MKYDILNNGYDGHVFCGFCKNYRRKGFCRSTRCETMEKDDEVICAGFQLSKEAEELRERKRKEKAEKANITQGELFAKWELD